MAYPPLKRHAEVRPLGRTGFVPPHGLHHWRYGEADPPLQGITGAQLNAPQDRKSGLSLASLLSTADDSDKRWSWGQRRNSWKYSSMKLVSIPANPVPE